MIDLSFPFLSFFYFAISVVTISHVVLFKRDTKSAVAWIIFIFFVPFWASLLYLLLGINRIKRKAISLRKKYGEVQRLFTEPQAQSSDLFPEHFKSFEVLMNRISRHSLESGHKVEIYKNGNEVYPEMLAVIDQAQSSVHLSTYIFDDDEWGMCFVNHLKKAVDRGVEVRVLIDAFGVKYSFPSIQRRLKKNKIPFALFLPSRFLMGFYYMNLRNHRKILVVDGCIAFTGGMNIRAGHWVSSDNKHSIQDLQVKICGPVVHQMQQVFLEDWFFSKHENCDVEKYFPPLLPQGNVLCRVLADGPDHDFEILLHTFLGVLATAQKSVKIITPYFLPDTALLTALGLAAMRGVDVEIFLPQKNNLFFVRWASQALFSQILEKGCQIWLTSPPFDHSKLIVVDDQWVLFGSANWDARSLRLNFELNLECFDTALAQQAVEIINQKKATAKQLNLETLAQRSLWLRLRDGVARLFSPYL